jgi:two-component system, OmpR family, phosphate regulon sensor histidine kinase PhoR
VPKWFTPALAVAVGALMAGSAALPVSPVLAFFAGVLAVLAAAHFIRSRAPAPAPEPRPEPLPAAAPAQPPVGFGRALVEKLPSPVMIVARNGRVAYANSAAHEVLPRLQAGVHFANLIRTPAFVEAVTATLNDGAERRFQFSTHEGQERHFEARVGLLPAEGAFGPEVQVIVQIEDRTRARRAEELRTDFIANASHELRTPLASIVGYIETLQNHARNDPEARERFLGIMAREAGRMQRLVDDLMSLSRIEMSEHLRPDEECSLNRIALDAASAFLPLAERHGSTLQIDLPEDGARVRGDRDQLAQVFANLVDNALKYGGSGATVRVRAAPPDRAHPGRIGVAVEDTGPGIPREHIHRLTERFYRVSKLASRNTGGTGLGLAIVKHILNRHGGRLEIASAEGRGSTFTVWLPQAEPARVEPAHSPATVTDRRAASTG